jgi:tetratricopeptide (TPR) repeat protein
LKPSNPELFCARGNSLYCLGNYKEAIKSYREALRLSQNQYWKDWYELGTSVQHEQGYEAALDEWENGIQSLHQQGSNYKLAIHSAGAASG